MGHEKRGQSENVFRLLVGAGLLLMVLSYFSPMWWVSLKAPNYPEHTFPDGVRIPIHWNGVTNGCRLTHREAVVEDVALARIEHLVGPEASTGEEAPE